MTANPPPRPALRRAADSTVHPADARLAPPTAPLPRGKPKAGGGSGAGGGGGKAAKPGEDRPVELVVAMPKSVRKKLRAKAERRGYTAEDAAYQLIKSWVDGQGR